MMLRSTALRRQSRITTASAPSVSGSDTNPRPEQRCCPCCGDTCTTPNRHDDGGCRVVGHETTRVTGTIRFTCGGCSWRGRSHDTARLHDSDGHRVTAWDTPTSQLPRSVWTSRP